MAAGKGPVVPTTQAPLQQLIMHQDVDLCLGLTAQMYLLHKEVITTVVKAGLPMMAKMAGTHPDLLRLMYAASQATLPEPIEEFYARMLASRALRQATVDDYRALYGSMFDAVHRQAALHVGTTDGHARDILATMMPAISQTLGQATSAGTMQGFAKQLKALSE